MAYTTKYIAQAYGLSSTPWRVELLVDGYDDDPIQLDLVENGVLIGYDREENRFNPIYSRYAIISLKVTGVFNLDTLQFDDERKFQVNIYKDNSLEFVGWLVPFYSTEAFEDTSITTLDVMAKDTIKQLSNVDFYNQYPERISNKQSFKEVISLGLKELGYPLYLEIYYNKYDVAMYKEAMDCPLSQLYFDIYRLQNEDGTWMNFYECIQLLLAEHDLRLFQAQGKWIIISPIEVVDGSVSGRRFEPEYGFYMSTVTLDTNQLIHKGGLPIKRNAVRRKDIPIQSFTGMYEYGLLSNLVLNGDLLRFTGDTPDYFTKGGDWSEGELTDIVGGGVMIDRTYIRKLLEIPTETAPDPILLKNQFLISDQIDITSLTALRFKADVYGDDDIDEIRIALRMTKTSSPGAVFYVDGAGNVYNVPMSIYVQKGTENKAFSIDVSWNREDPAFDFNLRYANVLEIILYPGIRYRTGEPSNLHVKFRNLELTGTPYVYDANYVGRKYQYTNTDLPHSKKEEVFNFGFQDNVIDTLSDFKLRSSMFVGETIIKTTQWKRTTESTYRSLIESVLIDRLVLTSRFGDILEASIKGYLSFFQTPQLTVGSKRFLILFAEYNLQDDSTEVVLTELYTNEVDVSYKLIDVFKDKEIDVSDGTSTSQTGVGENFDPPITSKGGGTTYGGLYPDGGIDSLPSDTIDPKAKNPGKLLIGRAHALLLELGNLDSLTKIFGRFGLLNEDNFLGEFKTAGITSDREYTFPDRDIIINDYDYLVNTPDFYPPLVDGTANHLVRFGAMGDALVDSLIIDTGTNVGIGSLFNIDPITGGLVGTSAEFTTLNVLNTSTFNDTATFENYILLPDLPTDPYHATNKAYVDSLAFVKRGDTVKTIALSSVTKSGTQTVSGYALSAGEYVLLTNQASPADNGVWVVASGAWSRSTTDDSDAEIRGAYHYITDGTYANQRYINTNTSAITLNTTPITYGIDFGAETDPVWTAFKTTNAITSTSVTHWNDAYSWGDHADAGYALATRTITINGTSGQIASSASSQDLSANRTWTLSLIATGVTASTYKSVTVDIYGRVTAGTNPTTLAGYGITDALPSTAINGTINQVAKFASSDSIEDSSITSVGASVGINRSSPDSSYALDVNGSALLGGALIGNSSLGVGIANYLGTSPRIGAIGGTNLDFNSPANYVWYTGGGTERFRYDSNGFKVGTAINPSSLIVVGNVEYSGLLYVGSTPSSGTNGQFLKRVATSNAWANLAISDVATLQTSLDGKQPLDGDLTAISALSSTGFLKRTGTNTWDLDSSTYLSASSGTTNKVAKFTSSTALGDSRITDNGTSVGIDKSSPDAGFALDVNGAILMTGSVSGTTSLGVAIGNYLGTTPRIGSLGTHLTFNSSGDYIWYTAGSIERFRYDSGGFQVGTVTNPSTISVTGQLSYTGYLYTASGYGTDGQFLKRTSSSNAWTAIGISDVTSLQSTLDAKQPLDGDLTAIAALSTVGFAKRTGTNAWAIDTNSYQLLDADLTAIAALTGTGILKRTGTNIWALDTGTYLTSTGTANYISKFTSSSAIGNSVLYEDSGSIGINATTLTGYALRITKDFPTSTSYGISVEGSATVASTNAYGYHSALGSGADGNPTNLRHFYATQSPLVGAIQNQAGFYAGLSLVGATNNYGFYGNIPISGNSWNLYMAGTANNYLNGNLWIGTTSSTYKLDVNGTVRITGAFELDSTLIDTANSAGASGYVLSSTGTGTSWINLATIYQPLDGDLTAIAALSANGFAKRTGTNTWTIDTSSYLPTSSISGTNNRVVKFTSATTIGDSQIFDNGTTVGIGRGNSPDTGFTLDVNGPILSSAAVYGSTSLGVAIGLYLGVTPRIGSIGGTTLDFNSPANYIWYTGGSTERFRYDSSGFKIGTTGNPSTLTVVGTVYYNDLLYVGSSPSSGTDGQYLKRTSSSNAWANIIIGDVTGLQTALDAKLSGSGTTNYLPKYTGSLVLGNSLINDNGSGIGIGTTATAGRVLLITQAITGNVQSYGTLISSEIQSGVTTSVDYFRTSTSTQAASFTLGSLTHYHALQGVFGAGSSVTSQYGFWVDSSMTGASSINAAFRGSLAKSSTTWNTYMDGAANNYMAGSLGIGSVGLTQFNLRISKIITGNVNSYGVYNSGDVQADVTSSARYFNTAVSTQAASFGLGAIYHYSATQGTFGAGSTVSDQIGYYVDSTLTGATRNYGFYGSIASGTDRWNLYMAGTAHNYLKGNLWIDTLSSSYKLDVNGTARVTGAFELDSTLIDTSNSAGTSGYVLTSTGTGISWINGSTVFQPLDGDLTAIAALSTNGFAKRTGTNTWTIDTNSYLPTSSIAGTNNRVTKFTSTSTIGDSQITDNGTSVGINRTNPDAGFVLDVNGAMLTSGFVVGTVSLGIAIANYLGTTPRIGSLGGTTLEFNSPANYIFYTGGSTERFRYDSSGFQVGTGANPSQISVKGDIVYNGLLYAGSSPSSGSSGQFLKRGASTNAWATMSISDVTSLQTSLDAKLSIANINSYLYPPASHTHTISDTTGLQTALDNKQPLDGDLTSIAALTGTGYAKRTGTNTWTIDNSSFALSSSISGTTNKVAKFVSSTTIGDSIITDNGTSVGINQPSPNSLYKLDVGGSVKVDDMNVGESIYYQMSMYMGPALSNYARIATGAATLEHLATSNFTWSYYSSGIVQKMKLTPTGLKIGAGNAAYGLDVSGDVSYSGLLYVGSSLSSGTNGQFLKRTASNNTWSTLAIADTTGLQAALDTKASLVDFNTLWDARWTTTQAAGVTFGGEVLISGVLLVDNEAIINNDLQVGGLLAGFNGFNLTGHFNDNTGSAGTSGYVLSSTGTATAWINPTSSLLTGYAIGGDTAISATDSILQAFQKVQGQLSAKVSGTLNYLPKFSSTTAIGNSIIYENGGVGIGTTSVTAYGLRLTSNITGGLSAYGIESSGQVQTGVTTLASYFRTSASTITGFTLTTLNHFSAVQGTLSGTVTSQMGFSANFSLTGATNNYGFYGNIAAATNSWNFYGNGTANNYMAGALGIGSTSLTGFSLVLGKTITGATSSFGILNGGQIQSDVTVLAEYNRTTASTAAASFTLPNLIHYHATQGTFGAGSSVTNQYGFQVSSNMTGATNVNIAFRGALASAATNWNAYMDGTANNYMAGSLGIGNNTLTQYNLRISKNITGAPTSFGVYNSGDVQSGVTSNAVYNRTVASTAAASFTLSQLYHYQATQGTFGAGSTVTTQVGYYVDSTTTGAANNYGFFGAIASGSGRWNIYMSGTANNYLNGNLWIGTTSSSYKLDVIGTSHFSQDSTFDANIVVPTAPTLSSHATNKAYVDSLSFIKRGDVVKTISLTNITLSGAQTISGYAAVATDYVLVAGQTLPAQNGVYVVAAGTWTRSTTNDSDAEIRGAYHLITNGTYANQRYINTNASTITVNTTGITYALDFGAETDPVWSAFKSANLITDTSITNWNSAYGWGNHASAGYALGATTITINGTSGRVTSSAGAQDLSGNKTWALDLASGIATPGTYKSVTVDTYGRVTAGTNPTTLAGYGIVDALGTAAITGTANKVVKYATTSTLGDSQITDNGTSVGINQSSPNASYKLDVNGSVLATSGVFGTVTDYIKTSFSTNAILESSAALDIKGTTTSFFSSGTQKMSINSTGVRIGTSTASYPLDILGNFNYTGLLHVSGSNGTSGQFLKRGASTNAWATLAVADISDIATAYQAKLSGTGFIKISGTTISYDNSTYLTTATATATYQPLLDDGTGLVRSTAGAITYDNTSYLSTSTAASTYQLILGGTGFVKSVAGVISYDTSTYLTTASASSTYLTSTIAASTYLSISNATATYATKEDAVLLLTDEGERGFKLYSDTDKAFGEAFVFIDSDTGVFGLHAYRKDSALADMVQYGIQIDKDGLVYHLMDDTNRYRFLTELDLLNLTWSGGKVDKDILMDSYNTIFWNKTGTDYDARMYGYKSVGGLRGLQIESSYDITIGGKWVELLSDKYPGGAVNDDSGVVIDGVLFDLQGVSALVGQTAKFQITNSSPVSSGKYRYKATLIAG